jgi:hypothetical protein
MTASLKGIVRGGRVEFELPVSLADGTHVVVSAEETDVMTPEEIARTLAAMETLQPMNIPPNVEAELDAWERQLNQCGIDNMDKGIEDVFR